MKKRKRKLKIKNMLTFLLVILVVIFLFIYIFKSKDEKIIEPKKVVYLNKIDKNSYNVDNGINDLIVNYMNLYYESISKLEYKDMSYLFINEKDALLNKTAIELLIESRKSKKFDMKIDELSYSIKYDLYEVNDDTYKVLILEDGTYKFNFMKNITSKAYGIENEFIIKKIDNEYKIYSYNKVQDFYIMIKNNIDESKNIDDFKTEIEKLKQNYIIDINNSNNDLEIYYNEYMDGYKINIEADYIYDRTKALEYANKYVNIRNNNWSSYDIYGGNCQNYASQIINAGGIPMDNLGSIGMQWKHYSDSINEEEIESGRSYSWTGVEEFYEYAKYNKGYGLVAKTNANYYSALEGDIAQVGYNDTYRHTTVVVGKVLDDNNNILDLIINSNSIDLENYPLQGYVYPNKRIIKIIGYNK